MTMVGREMQERPLTLLLSSRDAKHPLRENAVFGYI
jgi:hypothetical protein